MDKEYRSPESLTDAEQESITDFFVQACKLGIRLQITNASLAAILAGFAQYLMHEDRPLEFFVNYPKGIHVGPQN
jgi:hypothetical protein